MTRLSRGYYTTIDGVIYRRVRTASDRRHCVIEAVDPSVEPRVREVLAGSPGFVRINPSATYRGVQVAEIAFEDDGRAVFSVWPYPEGWPGESELEPYDAPERPGETVWVIRAAFSDLEDFDDGIPEEWRPFLRANGVDGGDASGRGLHEPGLFGFLDGVEVGFVSKMDAGVLGAPVDCFSARPEDLPAGAPVLSGVAAGSAGLVLVPASAVANPVRWSWFVIFESERYPVAEAKDGRFLIGTADGRVAEHSEDWTGSSHDGWYRWIDPAGLEVSAERRAVHFASRAKGEDRVTMLRDARADRAYFDDVVEYLAELCDSDDEQLSRPVEAFRDPKRLGTSAGDAMKYRWDRFSSLYSQGASVEELRAEYEVVLEAAERARRLAVAHIPAEVRATRFRFGMNKDFSREWLLLVSLALVFDVDDATFDRVVAAVEFGWGDRLLDRLIASRRPGHPVGESPAFPKVVGKLDAAFDAASPDAASGAVAKYLASWYPAWKGIWGWGGHEVVPKRRYHGYWAFETLGVVKALGLDDASFRGNEYYPRDLAGEAGGTDPVPEPSAVSRAADGGRAIRSSDGRDGIVDGAPARPAGQGTVGGARDAVAATPNDWIRLCELLDEDAELAADVRLAAEDPEEYFRRREARLADRGIESSDEVDPWLALIDGLDDAGALAYLDWKDTGAEVAQALAGVPRVARAGVDLDAVEDADELADAVAHADRLLADSGLRVVHLDEDSDAYPLVVVPSVHAAEIIELSARLGYEARTFG